MSGNISIRTQFARSASTLVAVMALSACGRADISEQPPVASPGLQAFNVSPSTVNLTISIALNDAIAAVNAALPESYAQDWTNGEDACIDVHIPPPKVGGIQIGGGIGLGKICAGTQYKFTATRGPIVVAAAGVGSVKVTVPISISGQGGFRGDGARLVKLDAKNFDGAAVFDVVLTPALADDWCPKLDVTTNYGFKSNPRVEIVERVNIDISGEVRKKLDEKLPQIIAAVQGSIDCAKLKPRLAELYGSKTFPIQLPSGEKVHVNVEPEDIAFSGLEVDATTLKVAASMTAKVEVSTIALQPALLPLPPLRKLDATARPRIALAVPLRAPYTALDDAARKALVGRPFVHDTPAGKITVAIEGVSVYPTAANELVLRVEFNAKLPGKLLDTKGVVFITGAPAVEGKSVVRINEPSFTRILDNNIWNTLSVLFDGQIRDALQSGLHYDFAPDIEKAKAVIAAKLADPMTIPNVTVSASQIEMGIGRTALTDKELVVEALFGATVSAVPSQALFVVSR